ncbi:hypothetical protein WJX81_000923 [Elliptochloris bilobata]|uniref:Viral late gene transcription factor 3 zinc ribbon domain-containing protein n=1 Tax=Elliptochloris bilobata TaxID=381761 RepID=A0AAW1S9D8_9CHLO
MCLSVSPFSVQACAAADAASAYVPGPVNVGPEIYAGALAGVIPFAIGSWEFGKRILIQRRCAVCSGSGLVQRGKFYRKCPECGGFFPWQGWRKFFTSTAAPGNGGPLRQPRGQTSILYKVPRPVKNRADGVVGEIEHSERQNANGSGAKTASQLDPDKHHVEKNV